MRAAIAVALLAAGCVPQPAPAPPSEELSEREVLALSMKAAAAVPPGERAVLQRIFENLLARQAREARATPADPGAVPAAPLVALALDPNVRTAIALDAERRASGREPLLLVSVSAGAVTPLPAAALYPTPAATAARSAPRRAFDFSPALTARSPEAVAQLEALLAAAPPSSEPIHVFPSPSAPFAILYAPAERALYVNPVLFALRGLPADAAWVEKASASLSRVSLCDPTNTACLSDALSLRTVDACVRRIAPACMPATPSGFAAIAASDPSCAFRVHACLVAPVVDSPCGPAGGACGTPCAAAGAESGAMCGSACGGACAGTCTACGCTAACDQMCMDTCGEPCGSQCAAGCSKELSDCGAKTGSSSAKECGRVVGESGTCRTDYLAPGPREPLPPPPPLDPAGPPPMRALAVTGARDLLAWLLPPILFLGLLRRWPRPSGGSGHGHGHGHGHGSGHGSGHGRGRAGGSGA